MDIFVYQRYFSTFFKSVTCNQKVSRKKNTARSTTLQQSHDTIPNQRNNTTPKLHPRPRTINFHDTARYYTTPHKTTAPHLTKPQTKVHYTDDSNTTLHTIPQKYMTPHHTITQSHAIPYGTTSHYTISHKQHQTTPPKPRYTCNRRLHHNHYTSK